MNQNRSYMRSYCNMKLEYKTSLIELKTITEKLSAYYAHPERNQELINELEQQKDVIEKVVSSHKKAIKKMECEIRKLLCDISDDMMLKVFKLRYINGESLISIAKMTNYSEIRIKQIHLKIKKIIS